MTQRRQSDGSERRDEEFPAPYSHAASPGRWRLAQHGGRSVVGPSMCDGHGEDNRRPSRASPMSQQLTRHARQRLPRVAYQVGRLAAFASPTSLPVQVSRTPALGGCGLLWPASEKRQGTKSREVGHRWCSGRYGDLIQAPAAKSGAMWCRDEAERRLDWGSAHGTDRIGPSLTVRTGLRLQRSHRWARAAAWPARNPRIGSALRCGSRVEVMTCRS
jgi:hypothetical protein